MRPPECGAGDRLDPIERARLYSDIGGTVESRKFPKCRPVVNKFPDGIDDGSADVRTFTNDAKSAAEILAAFLLDQLRYAICVITNVALRMVMSSHLRHVMAIEMLHCIGLGLYRCRLGEGGAMHGGAGVR